MPDDLNPTDTQNAASPHAAPGEQVSALVALALRTTDPRPLITRAQAAARTTRDRQIVAIARAYLDGDVERVNALARDHLVDHPDSVLVAWITARSNHLDRTERT